MRYVLFILINFLILIVLSVSFHILVAMGVIPQEYASGYAGLLIFSAILGFGGAFVSLYFSKWMVKRTYRIEIVDSSNPNSFIRWYVAKVEELAHKAGIERPEIGIYEGAPNAFATGASRNSALIAISSGLAESMDKKEIEGVIGHEIAHAANGDMVTMTLLSGTLNTFVIFFSRVLGSVIDKVVFRNQRGDGIGYFVGVFIAEILLGVLASLLLMWFSRYREYRADAGGAKLAGKNHMIGALQRLKRLHTQPLQGEMAAFGISGNKNRFLELLSSHPPLEKRIEALQKLS